MIVKNIKLSKMNPAPYNPRVISEENMDGLRESIRRFGLVVPIVWNKNTGHIVGGHQRYEVLKEDGIASTKVVVVDLDTVQEQQLNVSLNNQAIQGEWDDPKLQKILEDLHTDGSLSFDDLELLRLDELYQPLEDLDDMTDVEDLLGGDAPLEEPVPAAPKVRTMNVYVPAELYDAFRTDLDKLKKSQDADSVSDVIVRCIREAAVEV
jgi:ParB-like chromosome segregation protein Spo0J